MLEIFLSVASAFSYFILAGSGGGGIFDFCNYVREVVGLNIFAGIDSGSRALKIALWDSDHGEIVGETIHDQEISQEELASSLLDELLEKIGVKRSALARIVATGYGRSLLSFSDATITEISCHAKGVTHLVPGTRTIIDIGGQDSKLIQLDDTGNVRDFVMNDRCAAGTGSFLEMVARRLKRSLDELGKLASKSNAPSRITSMCVVFAETEILGLLAKGESPENIVAGVQTSIASRISVMSGGNVFPPVIFTGGVALIPGMTKALENEFGEKVSPAPNPQMTGAIGAAILASSIA